MKGRLSVDVLFAVASGVGLLALSIGAFGVLDAYHKRNLTARRVDWLIALYAFGVLLNVGAYTALHRWYIAAPLALMLIPADRALRLRGTFRRRRAQVESITGSDR
jgi:hypothetical protein